MRLLCIVVVLAMAYERSGGSESDDFFGNQALGPGDDIKPPLMPSPADPRKPDYASQASIFQYFFDQLRTYAHGSGANLLDAMTGIVGYKLVSGFVNNVVKKIVIVVLPYFDALTENQRFFGALFQFVMDRLNMPPTNDDNQLVSFLNQTLLTALRNATVPEDADGLVRTVMFPLLKAVDYNNVLQFTNPDAHRTIVKVFGPTFIQNISLTLLNGLEEAYISSKQDDNISVADTLKQLLQRYITIARVRHVLYRYLDTLPTSKCQRYAAEVLRAAISFELWGLTFLDAQGKPPEGLLDGKVKFVGSYDQCFRIRKEVDVTNRLWNKGADTYRAPISNKPLLYRVFEADPTYGYMDDDSDRMLPVAADLSFRNASELDMTTLSPRTARYIDIKGHYCKVVFKPPKSVLNIMGEELASQAGEDRLEVALGLCMPQVCSEADVRDLMPTEFLSMFGVGIKRIWCAPEVDLTNDPLGIVANLVIIIHSLTILVATVYDIVVVRKLFSRRRCQSRVVDVNDGHVGDDVVDGLYGYRLKDDLPPRLDTVDHPKLPKPKLPNIQLSPSFRNVFLCFSAWSSLESILRVRHESFSLKVLHGIRVLSMNWVILGQAYSLAVPIAANPAPSYMFTKRFTFQVVTTGTYLAVESFFVVGGVLTAYFLLWELADNNGRWSIKDAIRYYLRRIVRAWPLLAWLTFFTVAMLPYAGGGPFWDEAMGEIRRCSGAWWRNLLFIQNFYPGEERCLRWTWYIACDMQYYFIAPIFIFILYRFPLVGVPVLTVSCGLSITIMSILTFPFAKNTNFTHEQYEDAVYIRPYSRFASYAIGIFCGYLLFQYKQRVLAGTKESGRSTVTEEEKGLKDDASTPHSRRSVDHQLTESALMRLLYFVLWVCLLAIAFCCLYLKYWDNPNVYLGTKWSKLGHTVFEALSRPGWGLFVGWVILTASVGKADLIKLILSWPYWLPLSRCCYACFVGHAMVIGVYLYNRRQLLYYSDFEIIFLYVTYVGMSWLAAVLFTIAFEKPYTNVAVLFGLSTKSARFVDAPCNHDSQIDLHSRSSASERPVDQSMDDTPPVGDRRSHRSGQCDTDTSKNVDEVRMQQLYTPNLKSQPNGFNSGQ